jgi:hypothetical protein
MDRKEKKMATITLAVRRVQERRTGETKQRLRSSCLQRPFHPSRQSSADGRLPTKDA